MKVEYDELNPIDLGGTGAMYDTFIDGKEYLFKPGKSRYGFELMPYRAEVQVVGYKIQLLVDSETAIKCFTGYAKLSKYSDYIYGAFQERIKTKKFPLKSWQLGISLKNTINDGIKDSLLREAVTDYLLCNYDGHGGNFILDKNGLVRGVDKEQAYKYYKECPSYIDLNYSPNDVYGECEPIIHTLLKKYALGKIDMNLLSVYKFIDKIDKIDDIEYIKLFKNYVDSFCSNTVEKELLYEAIISRKHNLRKVFTDCLLYITQKRKSLCVEEQETLNKQIDMLNERQLVR